MFLRQTFAHPSPFLELPVFHRAFWSDATHRAVLLTTAVGALFRLYDLSGNPAGFFCDEAAVGVLADSVLRTGRDTSGNFLPILFDVFGSWRPFSAVYPAIPTVALFGLTESAVRMSSALYGAATIPMVYLLGRRLFSKEVGCLAALLLATLPWNIHLSRVAMDTAMSTFFATVLLYALAGMRKGEREEWLLWAAAWGFFFSYPAAPVQMALLILFAFFFARRRLWALLQRRRFRQATVVLGVPFIAVLTKAVVSGMLLGRAKQLWTGEQSLGEVATGYLHHFSYLFLAVAGEGPRTDSSVLRHSIQDFGLLLPGTYWLFAMGGLTALWRARSHFGSAFALAALLVFPVPASLIATAASANRSAAMMIPVVLLAAYGFELARQRLSFVPRAVAYTAFVGGVLFGFWKFLPAWQSYRTTASDWMGWQYGFGQAVEWASKHAKDEDAVFISHQYNGNVALLEFYQRKFDCPNCRIMANPPIVTRGRRELFFARESDVKDGEKNYPDLKFAEITRIYLPGGDVVLRGGHFEPR